ncbi:MAG: hypothetical protein BM559_00495 [Roseobacter sp. MedPE-SWchi]|nr:MAG: hypothetical protein BM559_00495 [Roseobacter sp. MedPE-SWchi]
MSDPVTQAEIEDVLSSIRRLVSEDGRSEPGSGAARDRGEPDKQLVSGASAAQQVMSQSTSRLVLTPALRVADETSGGSLAEAEPAGQDVGMDMDPDSFDAGAGYDPQDEADMDLDVDPAEDPAEVLAFRRHEAAEAAAAPALDDHEDALDEPAAVPVPEDVSAEQVESAPWRDPEATLFGAVDAPPQEDVEHTAEALVEDASHTAAKTVEADLESEWHEEGPEELEGSQRVSAVVQKLAELEAKVARSEGQWEPDGDSRDPYAGTNIETLEWQDHDDAAAVDDAPLQQDQDRSDAGLDAASVSQEAATDAALEALGASAGEDSYLDEDSLRELVADIVRSELQGALGERITRNVRKLVRREIHRALAAQDLI